MAFSIDDYIEPSSPVLVPPTALYIGNSNNTAYNMHTGAGKYTNGIFHSGWATYLDVTGPGVVKLLGGCISSASYGVYGLRVTIDGVIVYSSASWPYIADFAGYCVIGYKNRDYAEYLGHAIALESATFDAVPFNTQLKAEMYHHIVQHSATHLIYDYDLR